MWTVVTDVVPYIRRQNVLIGRLDENTVCSNCGEPIPKQAYYYACNLQYPEPVVDITYYCDTCGPQKLKE